MTRERGIRTPEFLKLNLREATRHFGKPRQQTQTVYSPSLQFVRSELTAQYTPAKESSETNRDRAVTKLAKQEGDVARVFVADFDGTVYNDLRSVVGDFRTTRKTLKILEDKSIPFIINTGSDPTANGIEARLKRFGGIYNRADAVITNYGASIFRRQNDGTLIKDERWEAALGLEEVFVNGKRMLWQDGPEVTRKIADVVRSKGKALESQGIGMKLLRQFNKDAQYFVRFMVVDISTDGIKKFKEEIESEITGAKVIVSESIVNGTNTFSGSIAVVPSGAGKLSATEYLLQRYHEEMPERESGKATIVAHMFGDASGDDFLYEKPRSSDFMTILPHAVNSERFLLASEMLKGVSTEVNADSDIERLQIEDNITYAHKQTGPEVLLDVAMAVAGIAPNPRNSWLRKHVLPKTYKALNFLYGRKLSANEVTLESLRKRLHAIQEARSNHPFGARMEFLIGVAGDLVDGYRARKENQHGRDQQDKKLGQLLDPFTDRLAEIAQLGLRAQDRLKINSEDGYNTLLSMVSCVLPSLARSETEYLTGRTVPENAKGSMLSRTRKLFKSFGAQIRKNEQQSLQIDNQILDANMVTFHDRRKNSEYVRTNHPLVIKSDMFESESEHLKQFRTSALERFVMNASILQDLDKIVQNMLLGRNDLLGRYYKWRSENGLDEFLEDNIRVEHIRQDFGFLEDPRIRLYKYANVKNGELEFKIPQINP